MRRNRRRSSLALVLLTLLSSTAGAETYYVSTTGNDSWPGSLEQPWKTVQKAADTLVAGDTVYVRAGTYAERVFPLNSGAAGQLVTYAAYPGEAVTIDGTGLTVPADEGLFNVGSAQYLRVTGFRLIHSGHTGIHADGGAHLEILRNETYDTASSGIGIWGCSDVLVEGNRVEQACTGVWQECISVAGTDGFVVRDNEVVGCGKEGICLKDGSANGQAYRNHVQGSTAVGLYVDAWDKHTHDIAVYRNLVEGGLGDGIVLASEQGGLLENVSVFDNVSYANTYLGLALSTCCIASHPMQGLTLVNNTVVGNGADWGGGIAIDNPQAQAVVVRNNLVSQNLSFQVLLNSGVPPANVTIDHNLIDGFRGDPDEVYGDSPVVGEAHLVDVAGRDFHLRADSPAIDQGSSTLAPAEDMDGTPRPFGPAVDIGADEAVAGDCGTDLDGDGRSDVVWRNTTTGEAAAWLMDGPVVVSGAVLPTVPTSWAIVAAADLDGDLQADLVWRDAASGQDAVWFMSGTAIRSSALLSSAAPPWQVAGAGDFDGDRREDLLWQHPTTGEVAAWRMDGTTVVEAGLLGALPGWTPYLGDLDGDGRADVFWRQASTGQTAFWLMNGLTIAAGAYGPAVGTGWQVAGLGDLDRDGKADVVWRDPSTGDDGAWLMNGTTVASGALLTPVPSPWAIAGVADLGGDGRADILWRDPTTGTNAVWTMTGATVTGAALAPSLPDPAWTVAWP